VEIFTLIKPNEDFLAWHDGNGKKLGGDFIWNWHLNREGSYSVSYLVQSLAFTKWMQGCFGKTLVAGLSQGGAAAMLNALQSEPSQAIVAAGHSIISGDAEGSRHNQLILFPSYPADLSRPEYLESRLGQSPTQWFFSWGSRETGIFKIEAEERRTAKVISDLSNVSISIFDGRHVFPGAEIESWIKKNK